MLFHYIVSQEEQNVTPVSSEVTDSQLQSGGHDTTNTVTHESDEVLVSLEKHIPDTINMVTDSGSLQENTTHNSRSRNRSSSHPRASRATSTPGSRGGRTKRVPLKKPEQTSTPKQGIRKFITESKRKGMETSPENTIEPKSQRQDSDNGT